MRRSIVASCALCPVGIPTSVSTVKGVLRVSVSWNSCYNAATVLTKCRKIPPSKPSAVAWCKRCVDSGCV